jgi:hypothetical protein
VEIVSNLITYKVINIDSFVLLTPECGAALIAIFIKNI